MKRLSRRYVLRGVAGTTLALPLLEIMEQPARAAGGGGPTRYLTSFCGSSLGHDRDAFAPDAVGKGYDLKASLAALGPGSPADHRYAVQDSVMVVSGLRVPEAPYNGTVTEPATAIDTFHVGIQGPLFAGTTSHTTTFYEEDGEPVGIAVPPTQPTSQFVVADAIGQGTVFETLDYKVQRPAGNTDIRTCMAYKEVGGQVVPVASVQSPQQAYNALVGQTNFEQDPDALARRDFLFRRRMSALDLAADDAAKLSKRSGLGAIDQRRLDRHFTELRELEARLTNQHDFDPGEACVPIPDPGPDPAFDGTWDNEDARAATFHELIRLAFVCDMTRSASILYSSAQNQMNIGPAIGYDAAMHVLTHNGGFGAPGNYAAQLNAQMAAIVGWHVRHFAQLVRLLEDTPDGPDTTLLDRTALVFLPEGGSTPNAHSRDNYAMLVAGRVGGLRAGEHVRLDDVHPAKVVTSVMAAVGAPPNLGELSGAVDALFV